MFLHHLLLRLWGAGTGLCVCGGGGLAFKNKKPTWHFVQLFYLKYLRSHFSSAPTGLFVFPPSGQTEQERFDAVSQSLHSDRYILSVQFTAAASAVFISLNQVFDTE